MTEHAYIHIPFCKRKCKYCSFISGQNIENKEQYINALLREIQGKYKGEKLETLYIGGGTPSLLETNDIEKIIFHFHFSKNPEITLEVNPETVELNKFKILKEIGINRISLGVQSFNSNILQLIGRKHCEKDIYIAIENIKKAGFSNISIDLIYGLPNETMQILKDDIQKALQIDIKHISTYGLKIEANSYFHSYKPDNLPNDEMQAEMFLHLCKELKKHNFIHYEISNFAKEGFYSKHNNSYWKNKHYYGFGLNASGYENKCRYKNISNFNEYILNPFKTEEENILSDKEIMEDELFLALRLKDGINVNEINKKYKINFEEKYKKVIDKYTRMNLLIKGNCNYHLSENGILLSNEIMSEFID